MRALTVLEHCPRCEAPLRVRHRRADACSAFPDCRFAEDYDEREQRLAERIVELEDALGDLAGPTDAVAARRISAELRRLIFDYHPDRRREPIDPTELVARLNLVRGLAA
jgi:ssDNA-binding Zn-finger/Zn-ribbon topoisomerase 1